MPPSPITDTILKTGRPMQRLRTVLQAQEESNGIIGCWLCLSAHTLPKTYTYFVLSLATRFSGCIRHFRRIQAVNLEWYTAAQDLNKVLGPHVPRYENGVFQQISRSQISQARTQSEVGLSCESEPQKFGTRRIRAEDL